MTTIIIKPSPLIYDKEQQFKQDICNAVNLLMWNNKISPHSSYAIVESRGRTFVDIWIQDESGDYIMPPTRIDAKEIIVAAGKLSIVRGGEPE